MSKKDLDTGASESPSPAEAPEGPTAIPGTN